MSYCPHCGGAIGRDCFNVAECGEITRAMHQQQCPDWQPIETAPKDGTRILAFMVDRAEIRKGFPPAELDGIDVIYWSTIHNGGWVSHRFGSPTHWMPLPEPPK